MTLQVYSISVFTCHIIDPWWSAQLVTIRLQFPKYLHASKNITHAVELS